MESGKKQTHSHTQAQTQTDMMLAINKETIFSEQIKDTIDKLKV